MIFIDAMDRHIEIDGDYDVEAFHDGNRIGHFEFDDCDGDTFLVSMNVSPEYRRAGIAVEMMRMAASIHGKRFGRPPFSAIGGRNASSESYFTTDGAGLFRHCIQLGIVDDTEPREYEDDESDY